MSSVKVGDRVRATCGESVIIGEAMGHDDGGITVSVEGTDGHKHWLATSVWAFEVIAPPVPDVVGTIVRDKDGDAWQRCEDGWHLAGTDPSPLPLDRLRHCAPFTVLWTPGL